MHSGTTLLIEHRGALPRIHPSAYVAPNATLSGDVFVGADSSILYGAVITAEAEPEPKRGPIRRSPHAAAGASVPGRVICLPFAL
jgi:hypothetical protein